MRSPLIALASFTLAGCAQHLFTVPDPNPTGPYYRKPSTTTVLSTKGESVLRADRCDTNLIDKVIVHQNLGQALLTVITLGLVYKVEIEYQCAKTPSIIAQPE